MGKNANAGQVPRGGAAAVSGLARRPGQGKNQTPSDSFLSLAPTWILVGKFKGSVLLQVAEALQPGLKPTWGFIYLLMYL